MSAPATLLDAPTLLAIQKPLTPSQTVCEPQKELLMPALSERIDFIEELMYRCWARRNYLPSELREQDWHPIILEEMARRDGELLEEFEREQEWNQNWASAFVPLVPTITHYVHPAQSEIREPHFLTAAASSSGQFTNSIYAGGLYDFSY